MRRRFQNGSLLQRGGSWVAQWWEDGHRRKRFLGLVAEMSKTAARREVSKIVSPINARETPPGQGWELCHFVDRVYLSFYRRKWKRSTAVTNEERINYHLIPAFGNSTLGSFDREGAPGIPRPEGGGRAVVQHHRSSAVGPETDVRYAVAEGFLLRNPAQLIFTPRECPRANTKTMTSKEVVTLFSILDTRERLIARLAVIAGMRPGEIFALKWGRLEAEYADIQQRIYRGDIDSPKSRYSVRWAALPDGLLRAIAARMHGCFFRRSLIRPSGRTTSGAGISGLSLGRQAWGG